MAGLYIERKGSVSFLKWLSLLAIAILIVSASWYGYKWFTTGQEPPIVSLPAQALADPDVDESPVTNQMINEYEVPANQPRYISIPVLGIDKARVQKVGLTKENMLDTPKNISDTAWYDKSALPGQGYGSVLIDGHNGGITRDGVFAKLGNLKNGDQIVVERGDSQKVIYAVTENKTESLKEANASGMKRLMTPFETGKEGLGLITCAGNWVPRDKVFDKRILIRAVAVE